MTPMCGQEGIYPMRHHRTEGLAWLRLAALLPFFCGAPALAAPAGVAKSALSQHEPGLMMLTVTCILVLGGVVLRVLARFRLIRRVFWLMPILIVISAMVWGALELAGVDELRNLQALVGFLLRFLVFLSLLYPVTRLILPARALQTRVGVPTLLRSLAVAAIGFMGMFVLLSWTFPNLNFTPMFVTSGVVSLVIGLALQDLLSNLMAGIVLSAERPFTVGDWVRIGDVEGEVVELTWRVTKVRTREHDYLLIPNSLTAKQHVTNYALPTADHLLKIPVGVSYQTPCGIAVAALLEAAQNVEEVLNNPAPEAHFIEFGESCLIYELRVWIDNFDSLPAIASETRKQIWYAFQRHGITIPFPQRDVNFRHVVEPETIVASQLVVTGGPLRGATFPLGGSPTVIGRHPTCQIAVSDPHVSAQHAVVEPLAEGYLLRDLGSRHGTRLNGSLISSARLAQGDHIEIEPIVLMFEHCPVPATTRITTRSTPATLPEEAPDEPRPPWTPPPTVA